MKKVCILLLVLMAISFVPALLQNPPAKAEGSYLIKFTTNANMSPETNLEAYTFSCGYADNSAITFSAELYYGSNKIENEDNLTYIWKDTTSSHSSIEIGNSKELTLSKTYQSTMNNVLMVGEKKYTATIVGDICGTVDATLTVNIEDNSGGQILLTNIDQQGLPNDGSYYEINSKTSTFTISAIVSSIKEFNAINWYLKTPNSSTFDLFESNSVCRINPTELITTDNGFGIYKLFATALPSSNTSLVCTSKMILFKATAGDINNANIKYYTINKDVTNNTKADLEAYTFTLANANNDGLDFSKIIWYVDGVKLGRGEKFFYEPTSSDTFTVSVKYDGVSLISLPTELEVTPKATGTIKLFLGIGISVLVLSVIFGISVKILNKKRDVVW